MDALLRRATSNDPNPTPLTIYTELAWLTHTGDDRDASSKRLASALAAKLSSSHTDLDARFKALATMKQVAAKGSMEFRRYLQAHKELVKEHLHFDAPPDELRGKEPHGRIRKAAKDALDAMFDLTPASLSSLGPGGHMPAPMSGVIQNAAARGKYGGMSGGGSGDLGSMGSDGAPPPAMSRQGSSGSFPPVGPSHGGGGGIAHAHAGGQRRPVPTGSGGDDYVSMDDGADGSAGAAGNAATEHDPNASITEKVVAALSDFITPPPIGGSGGVAAAAVAAQQGITSGSLNSFINSSPNGFGGDHAAAHQQQYPSSRGSFSSSGHGTGPSPYPSAYPPTYPPSGGGGRGGGDYSSGGNVDGFYGNPEASHSSGGILSTVGSLFGSFASFVATVPEPGPTSGGGRPQASPHYHGQQQQHGGYGHADQRQYQQQPYAPQYGAPQPLARTRSGAGFGGQQPQPASQHHWHAQQQQLEQQQEQQHPNGGYAAPNVGQQHYQASIDSGASGAGPDLLHIPPAQGAPQQFQYPGQVQLHPPPQQYGFSNGGAQPMVGGPHHQAAQWQQHQQQLQQHQASFGHHAAHHQQQQALAPGSYPPVSTVYAAQQPPPAGVSGVAQAGLGSFLAGGGVR